MHCLADFYRTLMIMAKVGVRNDECLKAISPISLKENPWKDDIWRPFNSSKSSNVLSTKELKSSTTKQLKNILKHKRDKIDLLKTDYASIKPVVNNLLNRFRNTKENLKITEMLQTLTYGYQKDAKEFLTSLRKILKSNLELRKCIQNIEREFRFLSRATSSVNILSWAVDIIMVFSMPIISKYSVNPRTFILLSSIAGSLSICGSLFAFSHAKRKVGDISKILRQDKSYVTELETWYIKSMKIDKQIQELFPHGINHDLIDQSFLDGNAIHESELSWMQYICTIVILSNIQKDAKLLTDEDFLTTVKLFVESPVARIWWNRLKIYKIMNGIIRRTNDDPEEVLASCSDVFQNRAVVSLFPVTIPLLIAPMKHDKIRIILGALGAALAAFDLAESKDDGEFEELKRMVQTMRKEYVELKKIGIAIDPEYD